MDHERLQALIQLLDDAAPRDGARVRFEQYGGGPDESYVVANREGCLRLGVEFLKAAYAPAGKGLSRDAVPLDVEYLLDDDSTVNFEWVERRDLDAPPAPAPNGYLVPLMVLTIVTSFFGLAAIGLYTITNWLGLS